MGSSVTAYPSPGVATTRTTRGFLVPAPGQNARLDVGDGSSFIAGATITLDTGITPAQRQSTAMQAIIKTPPVGNSVQVQVTNYGNASPGQTLPIGTQVSVSGSAGLQGAPGQPGRPGIPGPIGQIGPAGRDGVDGTNGSNGTNGTNGVDGTTWHNTAGAPSGGLGINGDYNLDTTSGKVYLKVSGSWTLIYTPPSSGGFPVAATSNVTTPTIGNTVSTILAANGSRVDAIFANIPSGKTLYIGLGRVPSAADNDGVIADGPARSLSEFCKSGIWTGIVKGLTDSGTSLSMTINELTP